MTELFQNIAERLAPIHTQVVSKGAHGQAAVLFILYETDEGLSLLLTQRSERLTHHPGEVALPGGMWEPEDKQFPVDTALRESFEEINLPTDAVQILGQLPKAWSRTGMEVTPVVARLKYAVKLRASIDETKAIFWVPINYLMDDPRERTDIFTRKKREFWVPAYRFRGYEIWGLTANIIVNFLQLCCSLEIRRQHLSPEKYWS